MSRAVILDVYGTLLEVADGPTDAATRWDRLWREKYHRPCQCDWSELKPKTDIRIGEEHQRMIEQQQGHHQEVDWPEILAEVCGVTHLPRAARRKLALQHALLVRRCSLMPGAAEFLRDCRHQGIALGICSNAQAYSRVELHLALRPAGLCMNIFEKDLQFWSFEYGFSKPSIFVFPMIVHLLASRSIPAAEALMIGDTEANDILPARSAGLHAFHFKGTWPRV